MHTNTSTAAPSLSSQARRPRAAAPVSVETPSEPTSSPDNAGFLAPYFRDLATVDVMTRDEELGAAVRIATLRQTYWRSILSYPPFIDGICELAREVLPAETCPTEALETMRKASRALRDRDLLVHQKAYEAARERLTLALAEADVDGLVSDRVLADLGSVEAGLNDGLSMKVKLPRRGSLPFMHYVSSVRANHHALWSVKNAFVKANLRLVVTIARRFNHGRLPLQDLIQEGNIGLMKAVDRFDHRKGFRFSTYGSWWIRHAISRAIADKGRAVRLPVHMIDAYHKLSKAKRELEMLHGREATTDELAVSTGIAAAKIERMGGLLLDQAISLDRPVSDDDGRRVIDFLEDTEGVVPGENLEAEAISEQVRQVITLLRPIEADILRKRFGLDDDSEELTLKEIGEQYSLSRERIRQLQEQAQAQGPARVPGPGPEPLQAREPGQLPPDPRRAPGRRRRAGVPRRPEPRRGPGRAEPRVRPRTGSRRWPGSSNPTVRPCCRRTPGLLP